MNQSSNILDELRELSPTLAQIPRVNVFKAPEGYFETLSALLLLETAGDTNQLRMQRSVPEGYFDGLAANIMNRIKVAESSTENSVDSISAIIGPIGNRNIFTVPDGYFETLADSIMQRISDETGSDVMRETNSISPVLAAIGNKNVFRVPEHYFETLSISRNTEISAPAKLVRMTPRRAILKYAAAAVITGLLATSAFFAFNKNENEGELNAVVMKEAESIIDNKSFDKELASLNDADIVNFLESKGQDVDAALVASLTEDTKALPEAADYLINENTLDEVLKDLDLNN
ncbi:MAG: hypothetical protein EOO13_07230 [Chitinophagaceae bacterium]|nr:MAG: hypothetical protein EOO13_07230 [Chitinophagaceae bacterium]